jgi:hypothetical protein
MAISRGRATFLVVFPVHLAVTAFCLVRSFGLSMSRFDSGEPATRSEKLLTFASETLSFPLVHLAKGIDSEFLPGLVGWLPFIANSSLWALVAVFLRYSFLNAKVVARRNRHAG